MKNITPTVLVVLIVLIIGSFAVLPLYLVNKYGAPDAQTQAVSEEVVEQRKTEIIILDSATFFNSSRDYNDRWLYVIEYKGNKFMLYDAGGRPELIQIRESGQ